MKNSERTHAAVALLALAIAGLVVAGCGSKAGTGRGTSAVPVTGKNLGTTARGAITEAVIGGSAGAAIGREMDRLAKALEAALPDATVERFGEGVSVTFQSEHLHSFDSAKILPAGGESLGKIARELQTHAGAEVLVVAHTDANGADAYNLALSRRRAASVGEFLQAQGIQPERIRAVGQGETEPIAGNETKEDRARNRRLEVAIFAGEEHRKRVAEESRSE